MLPQTVTSGASSVTGQANAHMTSKCTLLVQIRKGCCMYTCLHTGVIHKDVNVAKGLHCLVHHFPAHVGFR